MERLFILVLTVVTLGTATPHGYGVKGGASAKAEASAVAGAFGDLGPIPLSIPSGSGYSGSFSKSSASSFASSSASSSASSYSFSGSGANGIAGVGGGKGCSSGTCPGAETNSPSLNGIQQLSGANAVSAARANAGSGFYTPCQGNCNGSPAEKCTSGQCSPDASLKGSDGCTENGKCQSPTRKDEYGNEGSSDQNENDKEGGRLSDSDDFAVNINRNTQSKISHDSNGQYFNKDKSYNPQSDCSNGKCGSNKPYESNRGTSQDQPQLPSSYLTAPKKNPPCTTSDCNHSSQNSGSQTGGLPSSYNVPIQSATNPPNTYSSPGHSSVSNPGHSFSSGVPCTTPGCNSSPYNVGSSNVPNYYAGQQGPSNQGSCSSGQCDNASSNGKPNTGLVSDANSPVQPHGSNPSNAPSTYPGQGCTTAQCLGSPTYSNLPTNQPGSSCSGATCSSAAQPASQTKPSDANAPVYTGGFGGPAGFLDINSGSHKIPGSSTHHFGQNTPNVNGPTGAYGTTPTHGSSGTSDVNQVNSNNNYGSTQTSSNSGSPGPFEYNKPNSGASPSGSQFNPSSNGNYGGHTPSLPGSTSHPEQNGIYKPTTSQTGGSPGHYGGFDSSAGSTQAASGSNSLHGSYGVTKPSTPSNSFSSPGYNGNFNGPSGSTSGSSPSYGPTGSFNKPGNCGSAGCNGQPVGNGGSGSTSYDKTSTTTSSQNKPVYTGGFGGSPGFLNSNNHNVPSNNPTTSSGNNACTSGNCGSKGISSTGHGGSASNALNLVAASASADAAVYSGGFGGPPGFLKPYDDGKANIPAHGNLANGHSPSSNNGHPEIPSANGKSSEPGNTANGAIAAAHASATASATAGGYGGNRQNNGVSRGCNSGCSPNGAGDGNVGFPDGLTKDGLGAASIATAKSNAVANAYGFGSLASSSASAHAGAATKGGYGRK